MNAADRQRLRQQLEQLKHELVSAGDEAIEPNRADGSTRTDEDAQPLNEMNQAIASRRNRARSASLGQIERALRKLAEAPEDFGLCESCEEPIGERRLRLMPWAELCIECQAAEETSDDARRAGGRRNLTDFDD